MTKRSEIVVDALIADLTDRSGLDWDAIDEVDQEDIRHTWIKIIEKEYEYGRS
jgi:hypothetical protein